MIHTPFIGVPVFTRVRQVWVALEQTACLFCFQVVFSHPSAILRRYLQICFRGPTVALVSHLAGSIAVQIYPAIDLRGGRCVRLRQGDFNRETDFGGDPAEMALRWVRHGATFLHLVDLDGAREGRPVNGASVQAIIATAKVPCQLGGGLREESHIVDALEQGVTRIILGTKALQDPAWCEAMCRKFPGRIVLGLDARDGKLATAGWLHSSDQSAVDVMHRCASWPLAAVVFTDISKDGMLDGPAVESTAELAAVTSIPVIASGGVTTIDDVARLAGRGIAGCIIGRALYEGRIDLSRAIQIARKEVKPT
jgi:phosphoribosylformimino-5-aminoimidazole carboxamide ribotide isomerase